jgi:hypothetical protein
LDINFLENPPEALSRAPVSRFRAAERRFARASAVSWLTGMP